MIYVSIKNLICLQLENCAVFNIVAVKWDMNHNIDCLQLENCTVIDFIPNSKWDMGQIRDCPQLEKNK